MDKWLPIIGAVASVVGAIVSIGAAIWALVKAHQASIAATKAEHVRDELIERRKLVEVSQVLIETKRILKTVSLVGPTCTSDKLQGVSCSNIAKDVEEFSRFLNEQSSHFSNYFENAARKLCTELDRDMEVLSEAKSFDEIKAAGKVIYSKINNFMPIVKSLSDRKKERTV